MININVRAAAILGFQNIPILLPKILPVSIQLPDGSVHGQYDGNAMRKLIEARYIGGDGLISRNRNGPFGPIGIYFSHESNAFLTADANVNADHAQAINAYVEKVAVHFFEPLPGDTGSCFGL